MQIHQLLKFNCEIQKLDKDTEYFKKIIKNEKEK